MKLKHVIILKEESKLFFKAAKETVSARDEPVASTKR